MAETTSKSPATTEAGKAQQELQPAAPARQPSRFEEFEQFFDQMLHRNWLRPWRASWPSFPEPSFPELKAPKVDVIDRDDEVLVKAEIPGVDRKDLDISVSEDSLTIKGETRTEEKEEEGEYCRCEISRGSFSRSVALPAAVDGSKARATFKDGMLELTLPKLKVTKRHKIAVQ